jgi:3-oxo-5-alpha-steroid 4-dehydrogenase 3
MLSACRGKLMDLKPAMAVLGPLSDWTVPQRWFGHFYALGAAWNAAVAALLLGSPYFHALPAQQQATCTLALALLQLHLTRRLLETVGLLKYPPTARMHGIAYLFGIR